MILRHFTGGTVFFSSWLLSDGTVTTVKLGKTPGNGTPPPLAIRWLQAGGVPEVDSPDGYLGLGDCIEVQTIDSQGNTVTGLRVGVGSDPAGNWEFREWKGSFNNLTIDIQVTHHAIFTVYDKANPAASILILPTPITTITINGVPSI